MNVMMIRHPQADPPTATDIPPVDNPTVAAPGDGRSAKAARGQKKPSEGAQERDRMRAQVKDQFIQSFREYFCLL